MTDMKRDFQACLNEKAGYCATTFVSIPSGEGPGASLPSGGDPQGGLHSGCCCVHTCERMPAAAGAFLSAVGQSLVSLCRAHGEGQM